MFDRETRLAISHFFIARLGDEMAGYGGFWDIAGEAHIVNIAVHPSFRRRGVARAILAHLTALAGEQGADKLLLEVRASNDAALGLYGSSGFTRTGTRPKYYGTEDAVLMEKHL